MTLDRRWLIGAPDDPAELEELMAEAPTATRVSIAGPRAAWQSRSACRGQFKLMLSRAKRNVRPAKKLCRDCPVIDQCLHLALDYEPTVGIWGGMTHEERTRLCPVCHGPKEPHELACSFPHRLLRMARLFEQEEEGEADVVVSLRQRASARTNPDCIIPRGKAHDTSQAYKDGCRCRAALDARMIEAGKPGTRGPYKRRKAA